ncbi:MAG: acyl-CoA dehydrogenase family protein [Nocardioides sp.]|uniref:acyl-CoA dehydrogenase family protein n=1 Tax=Nocardioides sp. TaxID=35761 RepID=UPI0039E2CC31
MRLVATESDRDLRAVWRELLTERAGPGLWPALVEAGVLGLPFAEELGGAGATLAEAGIFAEEAGAALCPSVVFSTWAFGIAVDRLGGAWRSRLIPRIADGTLRGTVAIASPWDAREVTPSLQLTGRTGESRVTGTCAYVLDADLADLVLATAAAPDGTPAAVLLRPGDGVRVEPMPTNAGDRFARLHVGASVDAADLVTGVDAADVRVVALTVRALQCAQMVGGAQAVLERTVAYTCGREQFGRPIAGFQAAQHIVADVHIALAAARLCTRSAIAVHLAGRPATRETAIAVMHAARAYRQATLQAHQLHGGMGYVVETDLHRWSEHARELGVLGGGPDVASRWLEEEVCRA